MAKFPAAVNRSTNPRSRRRAVSGPALVVLALTLATIWFGSRALSQTSTESFDAKPSVSSSSGTESAPAQSASQPATSTPPAVAPATAEHSAPAPAPTTNQSGLPAGYPAAIPAPKDAALIKATAAGKDGDKTYIAAYQATAKPADASAKYQQQLKDAGFDVHVTLSSSDSGFFGAQKDALSITVSVGADQQASDKTNLTITTSGS